MQGSRSWGRLGCVGQMAQLCRAAGALSEGPAVRQVGSQVFAFRVGESLHGARWKAQHRQPERPARFSVNSDGEAKTNTLCSAAC